GNSFRDTILTGGTLQVVKAGFERLVFFIKLLSVSAQALRCFVTIGVAVVFLGVVVIVFPVVLICHCWPPFTTRLRTPQPRTGVFPVGSYVSQFDTRMV